MALIENTFFGERNKEQIAIERLKLFEPLALSYSDDGFHVADSGGKDSTVIKHLAELAGVKYEIVHSHTTADHPETVYFVRGEMQRAIQMGIKYTIEYPHYKVERTSIWELIETKGLPTRLIRWCCSVCKESGGDGKVVVTGVRWEESYARKKQRGIAEVQRRKKSESLILINDNTDNRMLIENCIKRGKRIINPIIDWSLSDVWKIIHKYNLPYNPLYNSGYLRVGCVGCPMSNNGKELEKNPKFKQMYIHAAARYIERQKSKGRKTWDNAEQYYLWWIGQTKADKSDPNQLRFSDLIL